MKSTQNKPFLREQQKTSTTSVDFRLLPPEIQHITKEIARIKEKIEKNIEILGQNSQNSSPTSTPHEPLCFDEQHKVILCFERAKEGRLYNTKKLHCCEDIFHTYLSCVYEKASRMANFS